MMTQDAVDLIRGSLFQTLLIAGPLLLIALAGGLVIGILQALFQIQDSAIATVPRLLLIGLAVLVLLPWMADRLVEYSKDRIAEIPAMVFGRGLP